MIAIAAVAGAVVAFPLAWWARAQLHRGDRAVLETRLAGAERLIAGQRDTIERLRSENAVLRGASIRVVRGGAA